LALSVYFLYKGIKTRDERKKFVYYAAGSIILGLTTYTHIISLAFIPIFLFGFILIFTKKLGRKVITNGLKCLSLGILSASLTIYEYINPVVLSNAGSRVSGSYSTFALSKNIWDLIANIFERMYYHISSDFLVITGGFGFAAESGFSETISPASLLRYGTGITGTLNYYGVIIYPALLYLLYRVLTRSSLKEERLLLWWIFTYAAASAVSYYDNPNAAQIGSWTEWVIDLQEFTDQGVNLANVNTITLGFGNRNNPVEGGSGLVYFDDIQLYRTTPQPTP